MHAIKLITPGVILAMAIGLIAFWLIYRFIFTDKRKK
jgi:hypothetical protein